MRRNEEDRLRRSESFGKSFEDRHGRSHQGGSKRDRSFEDRRISNLHPAKDLGQRDGLDFETKIGKERLNSLPPRTVDNRNSSNSGSTKSDVTRYFSQRIGSFHQQLQSSSPEQRSRQQHEGRREGPHNRYGLEGGPRGFQSLGGDKVHILEDIRNRGEDEDIVELDEDVILDDDEPIVEIPLESVTKSSLTSWPVLGSKLDLDIPTSSKVATHRFKFTT